MSDSVVHSGKTMSLYNAIYQETQAKVFNPVKPGCFVFIFITVIAILTGFQPDNYSNDLLGIARFLVFYAMFIMLVLLFSSLLYSVSTEEKLINCVRDYLQSNKISASKLQLVEQRALESKSSSGVRMQLAVIMVPALAATFAALYVIFPQLPLFLVSVGVAIFFLTIVNLANELQRVRLDDSILYVIKSERQ